MSIQGGTESMILSALPAKSMILSAHAESIILSAGGTKQQSTISRSKNVAMMAAAEAKVVAVTA
jgi:hypothetical protein